MKLIALYLIDYNGLTRRKKVRAGWHAVIIFAPVIAVILAHQFYGPSLNRIMSW